MAQAQRAESATEKESAPRRPEFTIRHGNLEIAGWRNTGSKGDFFTTSAPNQADHDGRNCFRPSIPLLHPCTWLTREAATKIRDLQKTQNRAR